MTARFALDEARAAEWLANAISAYEGNGYEPAEDERASLPEIGSDYCPSTEFETGYDTYTLVAYAHDAGIISAPTAPGSVNASEIAFEFEPSDDEVGYYWFLFHGRLKLASSYASVNHLGDEVKGATAALAVLREAVDEANSMLDDLDRYAAAAR